MNGIKQISGMQPLSGMQKAGVKKGQGTFADALKNFTAQVNDRIDHADNQMQELAVGKRSDLQEVAIASEKADLSFKLLLQVRNKLLEAYQEIMRMQV